MGVLFGFSNAQLLLARLGDGLTEGVAYHLLVEEDVEAGEGSVVRSEAAVVERKGVHTLLRHISLGEDGGELACTVVAEVVEDDGVTCLYLAYRLTVLADDYRLDELISHICIIRSLDGLPGGCCLHALALNEHIVGSLHAVPALVAVHCVEAAADACHLAGGLGHLLLELGHEAQA